MSLLSSLFGGQTSAGTDAAAKAANAGIASTAGSNAQELFNAATAAGQLATTGATDAKTDLAGGYGNANNAITGYGGQAVGALQGGVGSAVGTLANANQTYQPYISNGQGASGMLGNALGLNGAAGNAAATSAFQAAPGYQFQVDQATDQAARQAAALGMGASGNTLAAVTTLGQNLANGEYNNWLGNLSGVSGQGLTAANSANSNNQLAANYQYGGGTGAAGLLSGMGGALSANDTGLGTGTANVDSGLGSYLGNIQTNLGNNSVANNWMGTNGIAGNMIQNGGIDDKVSNANSGILSKALGQFFGPEISAGSSAVSSGVGNLLSSAMAFL